IKISHSMFMNLMTLHFQTVPATKKSIFVRGGEALLHGAKQQVSTRRIPVCARFETHQLGYKLRDPIDLSLISVLRADVLSFNVAKLAQLLPKRLQEDRDTGSSAIIQETYEGDFPCLLRVGKRNICQKKSCQQPESESILHAFFSPRASRLFASFHFIRPIHHRLRNRQTDLLRGLEIDHQLDLRRLLDRQVSRLGSL